MHFSCLRLCCSTSACGQQHCECGMFQCRSGSCSASRAVVGQERGSVGSAQMLTKTVQIKQHQITQLASLHVWLWPQSKVGLLVMLKSLSSPWKISVIICTFPLPYGDLLLIMSSATPYPSTCWLLPIKYAMSQVMHPAYMHSIHVHHLQDMSRPINHVPRKRKGRHSKQLQAARTLQRIQMHGHQLVSL